MRTIQDACIYLRWSHKVYEESTVAPSGGFQRRCKPTCAIWETDGHNHPICTQPLQVHTRGNNEICDSTKGDKPEEGEYDHDLEPNLCLDALLGKGLILITKIIYLFGYGPRAYSLRFLLQLGKTFENYYSFCQARECLKCLHLVRLPSLAIARDALVSKNPYTVIRRCFLPAISQFRLLLPYGIWQIGMRPLWLLAFKPVLGEGLLLKIYL
ncbi:hypothetical protein M9H77_29831 [Catharanthus roseus]|uniref:Uncharacterized protein n=1 Tax=Catharanthus roseus TaxID=4058 RepID=A0ACB9ZVV2_CATRO|nr:hypothetical protein M9H77_29831 [Catharanthus roseus]